MVSSAAIHLFLSRPRLSEGRSYWYNTYTYIDEHIKPKFEEFGFPLDNSYLYVGKYKDCRLSISIIDETITIHMSTCEGERRISNRYEISLTLFNTFTKDRFNYVLDSLYRWIEMTKGELS